MPENVVHYLNMKMTDILVEIIDLNFVVHPNYMACRKRGRLGLDHVYIYTNWFTWIIFFMIIYVIQKIGGDENSSIIST